MSPREGDDWTLLIGVFLNVFVCSAWFLGTCWFAKSRSAGEKQRVEAFFKQIQTPVDFEKEIGENNDAQQYRTLGLMALVYGTFISLLVLIPNSPRGRLGMFACAGSMLLVGGFLYWKSRKLQASAPTDTGAATPPETKSPEAKG